MAAAAVEAAAAAAAVAAAAAAAVEAAAVAAAGRWRRRRRRRSCSEHEGQLADHAVIRPVTTEAAVITELQEHALREADIHTHSDQGRILAVAETPDV